MAQRHLLLDQAAESFCNFAFNENMPQIGSFNYRIISGAHQSSYNINHNDNLLIVERDRIVRNLDKLDEWLDGEKKFILLSTKHTSVDEQKILAKLFPDGVKNGKYFNNTNTPNRLGTVYKIGLQELIKA